MGRLAPGPAAGSSPPRGGQRQRRAAASREVRSDELKETDGRGNVERLEEEAGMSCEERLTPSTEASGGCGDRGEMPPSSPAAEAATAAATSFPRISSSAPQCGNALRQEIETFPTADLVPSMLRRLNRI